ncbi:hypothetical protein [Streptomyces sp. GSL17-111]|uniref:hypothetical protein n=1 Tax=Streptomyces sp. GSL17-111 TaxID=3121596 RepID=UPI0030F3DCB4
MSIDQLGRDAGLAVPRRYVVDWDRVEHDLGASLPADYKSYVYWFGPGRFDDYLTVFVPGVVNSNVELVHALSTERKVIHSRSQISGQPALYAVYPEEGGVIPWAGTSDGDVLCWRTGSVDPGQWTIVGRPGRGRDIGYYDGGMVGFMHEFIWDAIEMSFISEVDSDIPLAFQPTDGSRPGAGRPPLEQYGYFE